MWEEKRGIQFYRVAFGLGLGRPLIMLLSLYGFVVLNKDFLEMQAVE